MNTNKELEKELDSFLDEKVEVNVNETNVITPKTGLVERIDKTLVLEDGRQLITERLF